MDRALQNVIKGCINELMDMGFKADLSKREIAALQNKMCNVVTSTMDEIAANSVLLNFFCLIPYLPRCGVTAASRFCGLQSIDFSGH